MHVKDMQGVRRFCGDGGDSKQGIELVPFRVSAGEDSLDLKAILEHGCKSGVERDKVANPEIAIKKSIDHPSRL